jgi:hypothetical protein
LSVSVTASGNINLKNPQTPPHNQALYSAIAPQLQTYTPAKPARTLPLFRGNAAHVRAAQPDTAALTRQWVDATKPPLMPKSMTLARVHVGHSDWLPDTHLESVASATSSDDAPLISFV